MDAAILTYLGIFGLYWVWTVTHFATELREMIEVSPLCPLFESPLVCSSALNRSTSQIKNFFSNSLGISDSQVSTMIWAEVVHRLVLVQRKKRLCISRWDSVNRVMGVMGLTNVKGMTIDDEL